MRRLSRGVAVLLVAIVAGGIWGIDPLSVGRADTGGPDAACYRWTDSNPPPPTVSFAWIDIQLTGTRITGWTVNADDGFAGPLPLGFNFPFYGNVFSSAFVGTNGYVSFGSGFATIPFGVLPDPSPPNNDAMGYGADLNPSVAAAPAGVYYEQLTAPNRFVVAWYDVPHFPSVDPVTFEIVLYETGEIWFQYLSLTGAVSTVGIEDATGAVGLNYGTALSNMLAIRFATAGVGPAPVGASVTPCFQSIPSMPGTQASAALRVTNIGTMGTDTFDMTFASPSGWGGGFLQADGVTPLADTNGNAAPDTGPLAPSGGFADIFLRVDVPLTAAGPELVAVTATSTLNASVSASADVLFDLPPRILSAPASVIPVIDGIYSPGEWADAFVVDLGAIAGNQVPALLLAKNDPEFLFLAYDGIGDVTLDAGVFTDVASVAFDTGDDGLVTDGREDQFIQGSWVNNNQAHWVYDSTFGTWAEEDSPYDPSLPNHAGLASDWGFGLSDNSPVSHRIYEFAIPLTLLDVLPGDTLGFFGGSQPAPGIFDATAAGWSLWPIWSPGPLPLSSYGDLVLALVLYEHDLAVTGLDAPSFLEPGQGTLVNASVQNRGLNDETNVVVNFTVNGMTMDATTLPFLQNGTSSAVSFPWTPALEGNYTVCVDVQPVPNENTTANNEQCRSVRVRPIRAHVLFDQTHGTDPMTAYSAWADRLQIEGFVVDTLVTSPITAASFVGYDAFVVPQARVAYQAAELSAIQAFVATGGGLLVIGDDAPGVYSDLSGFAGINWTFGGAGGVTMDITPHDVTAGVNSVLLPAPVAEMTLEPDALSLVRDPFGGHMLAVSEVPGRVAGFADEGSLLDGVIQLEDNLVLAVNIIAWLTSPDATPPELTVTAPPFGAILATSDVEVSWSARDARPGLDRFELRLDGGPPITLGATATNHTFAGLPDGPHTVNVTAFDLVGNFQSAFVDFSVDTTPPALSVTSPSAGSVLGANLVDVQWTASDATAGLDRFEISLDGAAPLTLGATVVGHTFFGLVDGPHRVRVTAFDLVGNAQEVSVDFGVDTVAPSLTITSPTVALTNDPSVTVAGTTEPTASVTVDGTPVTVGPTGDFSVTLTLPDGTHTLDVVATDLAGNAATAAVAITVDTAAPVLALASPIDGATTQAATVTVSGTTEPGVRLVVNGVVVEVFADGTFSFVLFLAEGTNVIRATATDAAGNAAMASVTVTYVNPLPALEQDLRAMRDALAAIQDDLNASQDALATLQNDLTQARQDLQETRDDLTEARRGLNEANASLASLGTMVFLLMALLLVVGILSVVLFVQYLRLRKQIEVGGEPPSGGEGKAGGPKRD